MEESNRTKKAHIIDFHCDGDFFYQKGMHYFQSGDLERASKYIDRAIKFKPNEVDYLCQQAEILSELEEYESSIRLLKKVVYELDSKLTDCYFFMANNYAYLGEFEEAINEIQTYLTLEPNGVYKREAQELFQMLHSEMKEFEEEDSEYITVHERGRLALEHGHFEEAVHFFKQVIEDEPDFLAAQNNLSIAYFSMEETDRALNIANRVLEKDPGNIHTLCNLATFYDQLNDREQLQSVVERLDLIYPFYAEHCGKLGSTYLFIGDYQKAYHWLRIAQRRGAHQDQVFQFWMALSAYHCGDVKMAKQCWKQVNYFSDKPFHPFKYSKIQDMLYEPGAADNFMVKELINKEMWEDMKAYQIFSLFYASQHHYRTLLQDITKSGTNTEMIRIALRMLQEWATDKSDQGLQIMREVESLAGGPKEAMKHPELYSFWSIVDTITQSGETDVRGWAAALIYLWKKEFGEPVAQKAIASQAGTTLYRLRKHIQELSAVLEKQWEDYSE
ncbi:tetratricopeptide repeat protein [Sporolactobacillus kofuensis]|uniref:Tetratricopeptide repeat protein n=1 Tax=Sporolactobacillus kofuensis TaxID=269672 RepID=A0ABW1WJ98_9BACL|nr:tetratricopeptide repeat protein [Sporolactobacillus kofuensis]MCO7176469.1 tetratricopeptide repeat protein [Sporolactobacillus kofuensis]